MTSNHNSTANHFSHVCDQTFEIDIGLVLALLELFAIPYSKGIYMRGNKPIIDLPQTSLAWSKLEPY